MFGKATHSHLVRLGMRIILNVKILHQVLCLFIDIYISVYIYICIYLYIYIYISRVEFDREIYRREYLQIIGRVYTNLNIKYYYVEATALSLLVNRYPLRQKGSDVSNCGVDATSVYALYIDSMISFLHKYSKDLVHLCSI